MEEFSLKAQQREGSGKGFARKIRAAGNIPAVLYGSAIKESIHVTLDNNELVKTLNKATSENVFINLDIEGAGKKKVIFKKIDRHPYKNLIQHIDFFEINAKEEIVVEVGIHIEGTAEGVKLGGILHTDMVKVKVKCLPGNIPNSITVDVTELLEGQALHISDLVMPKGVVAVDDDSHTVVSVAKAAKEEVVETEAVAEGEAAEGEAAEGEAGTEETKEG